MFYNPVSAFYNILSRMSLLLYSLIVLIPLFLAVAGSRALRPEWRRVAPGWKTTSLLVMTGLGTALFLFRPDEELEAGEDAAAYYHAARWFVQTGDFHISDPALVTLPPEQRKLFRHGDPGFMITKDHTLWADNLDRMDPVKSFFFPAYSLYLALPIWLGIPYAAFWLNSLLAAACGMLVSVLAIRITGRSWAGWGTYVLFLLHPAVAWHARCLRAEWGASFLVLAALLMWLEAVEGSERPRLTTGMLAGFSLLGGMLFHVTAIYVVLPAMVFSLFLSQRTPFWWGWWIGTAAGIGVFLLQTLYITDPYFLRAVIADPSRRWFPLAVMGGLAVVSIGARWGLKKFHPGAWSMPVTGGVLWGMYLLWLLYSAVFRDGHGTLPGLPEWTAAYISLTDVTGAVRMTSWLGTIAALAGLGWMVLRSNTGRWVFLWLAPASLTIGWMVNYMFETRRLVTFLVPLWVLGMSAGVTWVSVNLGRILPGKKSGRMVAGVLVLGVAGVMIMPRADLYRTWNRKGMFGFYRELSAQIETESDFLFGEYTQTSVPVERFTGLPLLPVSWDYRNEAEYGRIEAVFNHLVKEHPERRHVLLAPFPGAVVPGMYAEPLAQKTLRTPELNRARNRVPQGSAERVRELFAKRIRPDAAPTPAVYRREFPGTRLGINGASTTMRNRTMRFRGWRLTESSRLELPRTTGRSVMFLLHPSGRPERISLPGAEAVEVIPCGEVWTMVMYRATSQPQLEVEHETGVYVVQIFEEKESRVVPVPLPGESEEVLLTGQQTQWLLDTSHLALPLPQGTSWVWMLAKTGRNDDTSVTVDMRQKGRRLGETVLTAEWSWRGFPVKDATADGRARWVRIDTTPSYDPGLENYSDRLGVLLRMLLVVPD